jgi:hypothetical protein
LKLFIGLISLVKNWILDCFKVLCLKSYAFLTQILNCVDCCSVIFRVEILVTIKFGSTNFGWNLPISKEIRLIFLEETKLREFAQFRANKINCVDITKDVRWLSTSGINEMGETLLHRFAHFDRKNHNCVWRFLYSNSCSP